MIEVLVTIIIMAFGLLGMATLESKIQLTEMESYQRGQAIALLTDMLQKISVNGPNAASYVASGTVGTGDTQPTNCTGSGAALDICEWSNALKGAAEQTSGGANAGAMIDAKGCVTQIQAENSSPGVCQPAIYRVTVMWQGMHPTVAPNLVCQGVSPDPSMRSISSLVTIGLPTCS